MNSDQTTWTNNLKLQWVYNTCELLTKQHKAWSPFPLDEFNHPLPIYSINDISNGYVWIHEPSSIYKDITVSIVKGSIQNELHDLPGQVVLVLHGFVMCNFKCFSGDVSFTIHDTTVTKAKLLRN